MAKREWAHGLRSLGRFITTPSDLGNSFDAMPALAGPTIERGFERFAAHPVGRAMLAERPRRDLNALLQDRAALAAMPEGSFADAYLAYLGGEDMGSADYFLEAADLVKFAGLRPGSAEIEESLDRARAFVGIGGAAVRAGRSGEAG